ncbi:hypothetical protein SETIT_2G026500v2 [Setaria italica]|uniref:Uncharacterized protein n=1 Tax=Setaria italica TaxID=4555 RepID=A0A368PUD7_SETIT|nr:hypothetical protein SETIT_2G026500v2 [Setaria italica]
MTLREQYPCLYNIARHKQHTIAEVLSSSPINISWRRDLIGNKLAAWNNLYPHIANIVLSQEQDEFHWNIHPTGQLSVIFSVIHWLHSWIMLQKPASQGFLPCSGMQHLAQVAKEFFTQKHGWRSSLRIDSH